MIKNAGCIFCKGTGVYFNDIDESDFRLTIEDAIGSEVKLHVEFLGNNLITPIFYCPICGTRITDD